MTPIIVIFVKQMIVLFFLKAVMYNLDDGVLTPRENFTAYLLVMLYYIMYFNSMYKFAMSFYNIMRNAAIDESDIYGPELKVTAVFGLVTMGYGVAYMTAYYTQKLEYYGLCWMAVGVTVLLQTFLLHKYYAFSPNSQGQKKKSL